MRAICSLMIVLVTVVPACDGTTPIGTETDVPGGQDLPARWDSVPADGFDDPETASTGDIAGDPGGAGDVPAADIPGTPNCAPGEGCFLDPCSENVQCQIGYCVQHMGEGVCTQTCDTECPAGWSCQQLGSGPDLVFACISAVANLCRPCASGADCKSPGGAEDVCVSYGDEGSFCGATCGEDDDCPWGFSCVDVVTVDGIETTQCLADAGVCPCAGTSVELGLWTPCTLTNDAGTCSGKRICTGEGLSDCDADTPLEEICNGLDDDCDAETDEPMFLDGDWQDLCHDGNECTKDLCAGAEGCSHEVLAGVECKDGNPCTVADHCTDGICGGSPVFCDDENPCTDDSCDEAGGCVFSLNTVDCDDQDPCTVGDECQGGLCAGVEIDCDCTVDADCGLLEDGDACNGVLVCDTGLLPHRCVVDTGTVISCPGPAGGLDPCLQAACDPGSGACSLVPANEGMPCDDGDACSFGAVCTDGACGPGTPLACNDGNPCTDDGCDPGSGCAFTPNIAICDDGNACTDGDQCAGGVCQSDTAVACDDGNPCTKDSCAPGSGCAHTIAAGPCDDGNPCTINDACVNGACQAGPLVACDDSNPCTDDICDGQGLCQHVANQAPCDDGDVCTLGDVCAQGACTHDALEDCGDDNVCTTDSCDPLLGCLHLLNDAQCDDGDICTLGDHCHLGECIPSGDLTCDDGNACTDDGCSPLTGCAFTPNAAPCDDGNACTEDDQCSQGWCLGDVVQSCDDGNLCTTDGCDPAVGCVHVENDAPCDDGNACTVGDACAGGQCASGGGADCDDGNVCTTDTCHVLVGCSHTANAAFCDDGDACTSGDICADTACQPGVPVLCDDADACTNDSCDPENGCVFEPFAPCCGNGVTEPGEECDDGNEDPSDDCGNDCTSGLVVTLKLWGGGGSSGDNSSTLIGGPGGYTTATFKMPQGTVLKILVGEGGKRYGINPTYGGGGAGGNNSSYDGGSGGGGTFVFVTDAAPANNDNLLAIAGGGGGCAGTFGNPNSGGPGGGTTGGDGFAASIQGEVGKGGTQTAGGAAGTSTGGTPGGFYQGGTGNGATSNVGCGGGGGGYYGGGGGAGRSGAGGGGSGFLNEAPPAGFTFLAGSTLGIPSTGAASSKSPPASDDPDYGAQAGMSFNSGTYHGNPGRAVVVIGGQVQVFGYTGNVQTLTVTSP